MNAPTGSNRIQPPSESGLRFVYVLVLLLVVFLPSTLNGQCPPGTIEIGRTETSEKISVTCLKIDELTWAQIQAIKPELIKALGSQDRQQFERWKKKLQSDILLRAELSARMGVLDAQIAETEKRLRGLGFDHAEHDFISFKGQSEKAQQDMVSQLISRFRDYTVSKSESVLQESFLARVQTMKPKEINKLADSLQRLGADEPLFQEWLRSFSPKASRKVLVDGAKLAIEAIKDEKKLFKISGEMEKKTVQGRQEAALTVISMLGADYPAMKEIKLVASGAYDVGEAWVTIFILDRGIKELTVATEVQLANQKKIALRMKVLVDERQAAREKLAKLPAF